MCGSLNDICLRSFFDCACMKWNCEIASACLACFLSGSKTRINMEYRIGQRVRMLHDTGEGVVTGLIDKQHVEIDLGDDFPIDVHISEIIAIDNTETRYLAPKEKLASEKEERVTKMGATLFDLSMAVVPSGDDRYEFVLINPEPADVLFTCYMKQRNKYTGIAHGQVSSGAIFPMLELSEAELLQVKSFYFQVQAFVSGKGHPHTPWSRDLVWLRDTLAQKTKDILALDRKGWVISLREDPQVKDVQAIDETEFIRIRKQDKPVPVVEPVIDLHIEVLVERPWEMAPSEMLKVQLRHLEKGIDDAVVEHIPSMIVIHGVGEGVLRAAVQDILRKHPHVKSFEGASPVRFGNGATKVIFN